MPRILCILLFASAALSAGAIAQTPERAAAPPVARPWSPPFEMETVDLPVSVNGIGYRLFIRKPIKATGSNESPVAIYVLDGLWDTPAVAAIQSNGEMLGHFPPLVYVGIGYQNENEGMREEANRTRDYTPTRWAPADPAKHFLKPVSWEGSGGANAFLDVVDKEIIPFVEKRYGVSRTVRGLVGKSLGGLLATNALLTRPSLFSHYLIISPALWWDDYFLDYRDRAVMRQERATHQSRLTRPTMVWIGMGEGEERLGMLADVYVLGRSLRIRNDSNLNLTIDVLEDEIHETIFAPAFARGVKALFWR